jgi:superfamily I DNA and/or RNA helicase
MCGRALYGHEQVCVFQGSCNSGLAFQSSLLAIMQGRLVLVGDPQQLPPTVLSKGVAVSSSLSQSLFERLQKAGTSCTLLREQFRMHPAIAAFPAAYFYSGNLQNGVSAEQRSAAYHQQVLTFVASLDAA